MSDQFVATSWKRKSPKSRSGHQVGEWRIHKTELRVFAYWKNELAPRHWLKREKLGAPWIDETGARRDSISEFTAGLPKTPLSP